MDASHLVRDSGDIAKVLKVVDDKLVAGVALDIHLPIRYVAAKLAVIGKRTTSVAIFPVIYGNKYAVCNICSSLELSIQSLSSTMIQGEEYYILHYEAGEIVSPNINMVVSDDDVYNIFNEFIGKAKLPWFMNYEDLGKCIAGAHYYGGITLSGTNAVIELIVSSIARSANNPNTCYRNAISKMSDQVVHPVVVLPFRSVIAGTTNTMGKLIGSYFDEGLTSALTHEGGPPGVEDLFRL